MMRLILSVTFATVIVGLTSVATANDVPCKILLKALRTTAATVKLNDADRAEINELEAKGVERCNVHDDKRADVFLIDALRVIGMSPSITNPPT